MKNILSLILLASLIFLGFELYSKTYNPCDQTIYYKTGTIDPKFSLSQSEVLENLEEASGILNDAYGKKLFSYSEDGDLVVNFIFDERSELNSNIKKQIGEVDQKNETLKELVEKFQKDVSVFEKKLADFNAKVETYNNQGGAPPDVYDQLIQEQKSLQAEGDELNKRRKIYNLEAVDYNLKVSDLNENVNNFNNVISRKPEEGIYNSATNSITVYLVNSNEELIHTIAHEFGHALGMEHVDEATALMYPWTSEYIQVSEKDLAELNNVCEEVPAYKYWSEALLSKVIYLQSKIVIN